MEKKQLAVELDRILRLDTKPVGSKLYNSQDYLPRKPFNFKLNLCQLVAMARYQGKTNTGTPDKMICAMGAACVGLIDTPEAIASGKAAVGAYVKDQTAGKAFMDNTFKIGDTGKQYDAILAGALESMEEDPDVGVMYVLQLCLRHILSSRRTFRSRLVISKNVDQAGAGVPLPA